MLWVQFLLGCNLGVNAERLNVRSYTLYVYSWHFFLNINFNEVSGALQKFSQIAVLPPELSDCFSEHRP